MEMTKAQLARVAQNMLAWLEKGWTVEKLQAVVDQPDGSTVDDKHAGEEYVIVARHPRAPGAIVINYYRRNGQTPMSLILNPQSSYTKIMLTCTEELPGFEAFDSVPQWGKLQDKKIEGIDFATIRQELAALAKLSGPKDL